MIQDAIAAAYANRWEDALDLLLGAAEAGQDTAQAQLGILAGEPGDDDWRRLRISIDTQKLVTPRPLDRLSGVSGTSIGVSRGYAPPAMCGWLIERAIDHLEPSLVNDVEAGQTLHANRTAMNCAFGPQDRDMIIAVLQARAARLTNLPVDHHEAPNVISYLPGQQFGLHVDFVDPTVPAFQRELQILGQRVITIVTYLNDDFDDAPTHFPALGLDFRGNCGDALAFSNVRPDGSPDRNTVHAGKPPTRGRKWVLSQWVRNRPQPLA